MHLFLEGCFLCFLLLLTCVVGIANGPVGLVLLYEEDVQQRVIALGYTTKAAIRRRFLCTSIALFVPLLVFVPAFVYGINGATSFLSGFLQMTALYLMVGLFDRLFIDWYWVSHTRAWLIPGTEDLRPYIPKKVLIRKWVSTLVVFPLFAALLAGVVEWVR